MLLAREAFRVTEAWRLGWVILHLQYRLNISSLWAWGQRVGKRSSPLLHSAKPDSSWEKSQYFQLCLPAAMTQTCELLSKHSSPESLSTKGAQHPGKSRPTLLITSAEYLQFLLVLLGAPLTIHKNMGKKVGKDISCPSSKALKYAACTPISVMAWFSQTLRKYLQLKSAIPY